ncbi:MAG: glycosyltransferase family 2 protein [Candidatus Nanoarchaeia archaeon]|nr:glycosyltransferase family 2 protein [Candidatus Nanoarchaeia archaeon]
MNKKIGIAIPAYNAEKTIEGVWKRIPLKYKKESIIILVDDGSKDNTSEVAKKLGIKTIKHPKNRGYGGAQKTGFRYLINKGADVCVLLHSDGQYPPEELDNLTQPFLNDEADAVIGSRHLGKKLKEGKMPLYKIIGSKVLTGMLNIGTGLKITEYHSGYRLYSSKALNAVDFEKIAEEYDFDAEITLQLKDAGMRIKELPIPTRYAEEVSHLKPFRYGVQMIKLLMRYWGYKIRGRPFHKR